MCICEFYVELSHVQVERDDNVLLGKWMRDDDSHEWHRTKNQVVHRNTTIRKTQVSACFVFILDFIFYV